MRALTGLVKGLRELSVIIPKWAKYAAMDEDGEVLVYAKKPEINISSWYVELHDNAMIIARVDPSKYINWTDSLVEIMAIQSHRCDDKAI